MYGRLDNLPRYRGICHHCLPHDLDLQQQSAGADHHAEHAVIKCGGSSLGPPLSMLRLQWMPSASLASTASIATACGAPKPRQG